MEHLDVLIVGAGISGIAAAAHLARRCPERRFAILEARAELGGTWDLFRYPGVRSDSDMYTLGFSFRPWAEPQAIVDGARILQYLQDTAREQGLYSSLRLGHAVQRASWSSQTCRWTVTVAQTGTGQTAQLSCELLYLCTGYYDYARGHRPELPGIERFQGAVVHPQHWPPELDLEGKRIVVVGSGATALTLVPALARTAAHVTLLQRSPSYVLALAGRDPWLAAVGGGRGARLVAALARWRNILVGLFLFQLARRFPRQARRLLIDRVRRAVGSHCDVDTHFSPRYKPWDQRLCIARDGDLFGALRSGKASVVTDSIQRFSESGLLLAGGTRLPADVVVTATGLELQLLSNIELSVDGVRVDAAQSLSYRGMMFSGIPNLVFSFGYTNASWTLRSELTAVYVCRLLQYMRRRGYRQCRPRPAADPGPLRPFVDLTSGYVLRAVDRLPRQGSRAPWRVSQNYVLDRLRCWWPRFSDGNLEFSPAHAVQATPEARREDQMA